MRKLTAFSAAGLASLSAASGNGLPIVKRKRFSAY